MSVLVSNKEEIRITPCHIAGFFKGRTHINNCNKLFVFFQNAYNFPAE